MQFPERLPCTSRGATMCWATLCHSQGLGMLGEPVGNPRWMEVLSEGVKKVL